MSGSSVLKNRVRDTSYQNSKAFNTTLGSSYIEPFDRPCAPGFQGSYINKHRGMQVCTRVVPEQPPTKSGKLLVQDITHQSSRRDTRNNVGNVIERSNSPFTYFSQRKNLYFPHSDRTRSFNGVQGSYQDYTLPDQDLLIEKGYINPVNVHSNQGLGFGSTTLRYKNFF